MKNDFAVCKLIAEDKVKKSRFFQNENANIISQAVYAAVIIMFGAMLMAKIQPSIVGTDNATNASISTLTSNIWSYYGLTPLIILGMIFGAIMIYISFGQRG